MFVYVCLRLGLQHHRPMKLEGAVLDVLQDRLHLTKVYQEGTELLEKKKII